MQAVRMMSVNMAVRFHSLQYSLQKEGSLQLIMQHADNQQSRPAANLQQPSLPAADPQQLGPSRLPSPIPQQPSPLSGPSVNADENDYTLNSKDMLLAPGPVSGLSLSSSSDETELFHHNHLQHPMTA